MKTMKVFGFVPVLLIALSLANASTQGLLNNRAP